MKVADFTRQNVKDLSMSMKPKPSRYNNYNHQKMLEWRRNKVLELSSQGHNQAEIADILQVSEPTVSRDHSYFRRQAKDNIKKYIDERLPQEYEKCLVGLTSILKEAWNTAINAGDNREKIHALSLAKECYVMKLELLTDATVVNDAIRFVAERSETTKDYLITKNRQDTVKEESQITRPAPLTTTTNQVF